MTEEAARRLRRNAVALRLRPKLREAVLAGEVSLRKAEVVLEGTLLEEDAYWAEKAKACTVRQLEAAVRRGVPEDDVEVAYVSLPPGHGEVVDFALECARVVGDGLSRNQQVEALLMEFLGEFPAPDSGPLHFPVPAPRPAGAVAAAAAVAADVGRLQTVAPEVPEGPLDAFAQLARLKGLVQEARAVEGTLRRACALVKASRAHGWAGFPSFQAWCSEVLGLPQRTVRALVAVYRAFHDFPLLEEAAASGTLTQQKAVSVARKAWALAVPAADVGRLVAEAAARPALEAQRAADKAEADVERQAWDAGSFRATLLSSVALLLKEAVVAGWHHFHEASPGRILLAAATHFLRTWFADFKRMLKAAHPALRRDDFQCQVPGCSRHARHVHHVKWKSLGGSNRSWNLVSVCAFHHLRCIHQGYLDVFGTAATGFTWDMGEAGGLVVTGGPAEEAVPAG